MSRKEQLEKEKNAILSKDVATKNPIFEAGQITELFNMFSLYADPRNKKTDIRDVLVTARTLGLHEKYHLVFNALEQIADARKGDPIDFETFLKDLTAKLGSPYTEEGRSAAFSLLDIQGKNELDLDDLRYLSEQLRYGFKDSHLEEIIKIVGGSAATTITHDRWNKYLQRRTDKTRIYTS